jgi:hypothetical protein
MMFHNIFQPVSEYYDEKNQIFVRASSHGRG